MNTKVILMIMRAIQGKEQWISDTEVFNVCLGKSCTSPNRRVADFLTPEYIEAVKHLDNNPLFSGDHKPTNNKVWNRWRYVGKPNDQ